MMQLAELLTCAVLFAATSLCAKAQDSSPKSKPQRSPDGSFEVYQTPSASTLDADGRPFLYGTKLYLRAAGTKSPGVVIRSNDRWMDQRWCPGTGLLAVQDCWDTHESDVYVYEVSFSPDRRTVHYRLVFRSPWNTVDHLWSIDGWDPKQRRIRLTLDQWGDRSLLGHEHWRAATGHFAFAIGTTALDDAPEP